MMAMCQTSVVPAGTVMTATPFRATRTSVFVVATFVPLIVTMHDFGPVKPGDGEQNHQFDRRSGQNVCGKHVADFS